MRAHPNQKNAASKKLHRLWTTLNNRNKPQNFFLPLFSLFQKKGDRIKVAAKPRSDTKPQELQNAERERERERERESFWL